MPRVPSPSRARPHDRSESSAAHRERTTLGVLLTFGSGIALIAEFVWSTADASRFDETVVVVLLVVLIAVGIALLLAPDERAAPSAPPRRARSTRPRPRSPRAAIAIVPSTQAHAALVMDRPEQDEPNAVV